MKLVESCNYYEWKENIEKILEIEKKPFVKIRSTCYQGVKYYMYGGMVDNKLRFYFYPNEKPNAQIDYILIDPQDLYFDRAIIYKDILGVFEPFAPSDLLDITYTKNFEVGKPYKIVKKDGGTLFYGFYIHQVSNHCYDFDCYSSSTKVGCKIRIFEDLEYNFYSLDD